MVLIMDMSGGQVSSTISLWHPHHNFAALDIIHLECDAPYFLDKFLFQQSFCDEMIYKVILIYYTDIRNDILQYQDEKWTCW